MPQIVDVTLTGKPTSVDLDTSHTDHLVTTKIEVQTSRGFEKLAEYNVHSHSRSTTRVSLHFSASMKISITTLTGKSIPLEVQSSDTIADVKAQIEEKKDIPSDEQRLSLRGKELEDDGRTLAEYNIGEYSVLDLLPPVTLPVGIFFKTHSGKKAAIQVRLSDTVLSLKEKIEEKEGIPVDQQRFHFDGRGLENGRTLADCNIRKGSILDLHLSMRGD